MVAAVVDGPAHPIMGVVPMYPQALTAMLVVVAQRLHETVTVIDGALVMTIDLGARLRRGIIETAEAAEVEVQTCMMGEDAAGPDRLLVETSGAQEAALSRTMTCRFQDETLETYPMSKFLSWMI